METLKRKKFTVLVEENELVRHLWEEYYSLNEWPLEVFENPLEFLAQLDRFRERDERMYFFFDQDFGNIRGVGVQLARAVRGLNTRQTVCLVTLHLPMSFQQELREGLLQYVFEKYPEGIFGENFLTNQFRENPNLWRYVGRDSKILERLLNNNGLSQNFTLEEHFPSLVPESPTPTEILPLLLKPNFEASNRSEIPWWKRLRLFVGAEA